MSCNSTFLRNHDGLMATGDVTAIIGQNNVWMESILFLNLEIFEVGVFNRPGKMDSWVRLIHSMLDQIMIATIVTNVNREFR